MGTCSQLSQLMGAPQPRSPFGAETRLTLWYTQTSLLRIPVPEHRPPGGPPAAGILCFIITTEAMDTTTSSTITNTW